MPGCVATLSTDACIAPEVWLCWWITLKNGQPVRLLFLSHINTWPEVRAQRTEF